MSNPSPPQPSTASLPPDEAVPERLLSMSSLGAPISATLISAEPPVPASGTKVRCPTCHSPLALSDRSRHEVLCPACGDTFRVEDSRLTDTLGDMRTLGKFQLLERVGLGGFGAVWKARDLELDCVVAL